MELIQTDIGPFYSPHGWLTDSDGEVRVEASARVRDSAQVYGSAQVCGAGDIATTSDYITLGQVGTEERTITLHRDRDVGIRVVAGCWDGSLAEFMARLTDEPAHGLYRRVVPILWRELRDRMTPLYATWPGVQAIAGEKGWE
jgi:hypothetical protein